MKRLKAGTEKAEKKLHGFIEKLDNEHDLEHMDIIQMLTREIINRCREQDECFEAYAHATEELHANL